MGTILGASIDVLQQKNTVTNCLKLLKTLLSNYPKWENSDPRHDPQNCKDGEDCVAHFLIP